MHKMIAGLCLLCVAMFGQEMQQQQIQLNRQDGAAPTNAAKPATKKQLAEKAQQQERGLRLLEVAEAQAGGLQGGMRAYAFWQLARTYQPTNKAKALELLENAMTATRDMEDEGGRGSAKTTLQEEILRSMVPLAPQRAEELLAQVPAEDREPVLNSLLAYYQKTNDLDHGMELVYRIGQEKEIPYQAAGRIMAALPAERSGDLLQMFTVAFASYRDHQHSNFSIGSDLGSLVVQFWQKLPVNVVHDAIRELLKQADDVKDAHMSMSTDKGTAAFNSYYEYRLFQLLPVLRHIDESEADELLQKNQEMKAMLAKYPDGMAGMGPTMPAPPPAGGPKPEKKEPRAADGMGMSFSTTMGGARSSGADAMMVAEQQARKILADADEHPDTAIMQASSISNLSTRINVYQAIARANTTKKPSIARNALEKALAIVDQVQPVQQVGVVRSAAELYLQMGETEDAKKTVERGFKLAEKLLATDTDADDPNKALKAYWPSAEAWRSFTRLAGQISPTWAMAQVNEISDPDMKVLAQTSLAQGWLDVSRGSTWVMSDKKNGNMMMGSREDPR